MPAVKEAPSYSSARVQRASRINSIESARLLQQLQCIERAKQHQCRLTNQDIRLVSLSLDYIQSSSGNSPEAWRPSDYVGGDAAEEARSEGPCFLYGERIISRKMKRMQRPMSAVERVMSSFPDDCSVTSEATSLSSSRPRSSPGKHARRPVSAAGWARYGEADQGASNDYDPDVTSESRHAATEFDRMSTSSVSSSRATPREAWEDDTSPATKKILKAQALAQSGKRSSLYVSAGDVMAAQTSRNVRNLARMIRVTSAPVADSPPHRPVSRQNVVDKPPQRPSGIGRDSLGRRATIGEILNQHKPTLTAGAWRHHLKQTAINPMSVSSQRQARLDAKKQLNETEKEEVNEKVKSFVRGNASPRWRRKSVFI